MDLSQLDKSVIVVNNSGLQTVILLSERRDVIAIHWQDANSSSSNAAMELFPKAESSKIDTSAYC